MAKAKQPAASNEIAGGNTDPSMRTVEKLTVSSVEAVPDPGGKATNEIKLAIGEVLITSIDDNGQEFGPPMKVSESTFQRYYNDETKFKLLKKSL